METIRKNVFETNSSSTHSLTMVRDNEDYLSPSSTLVVDFIDTDEYGCLSTLKEKVSYLVSQIINRYKYDVYDYEDLKEQVEGTYDFQRLADYVMERYGKKLVLPKCYNPSKNEDLDDECEYNVLEEIVNINHQIVCNSLDELLEDLVADNNDLLDRVLDKDFAIVFGRD